MEGNHAKLQLWLTATQPTFEPRRLPAGWTYKTSSKLSKLLCAWLQECCFGINLCILCYHTSSTNTNFNLRVARAIFFNFQTWNKRNIFVQKNLGISLLLLLIGFWRICRFSQSVQKKAAWFQTDHNCTLSHPYFLTICDNVPVSCHGIQFLLWKRSS